MVKKENCLLLLRALIKIPILVFYILLQTLYYSGIIAGYNFYIF